MDTLVNLKFDESIFSDNKADIGPAMRIIGLSDT